MPCLDGGPPLRHSDEEHNRRRDDNTVSRIAKLWPILLAMIAVVTTFAVMKKDVEDNKDKLKVHEKRLTNVEINAAVARINTDALVQRFLAPAEQRQLQSQVETVSSYLLQKAGEDGEKGRRNE